MQKKLIKKTDREIYGIEKDGQEVNPPPRETLRIKEGEVKIGLSKTVTINMGNYESIKLGMWMEKIVSDNPKAIDKGIEVVVEKIDDYLNNEIKVQRS